MLLADDSARISCGNDNACSIARFSNALHGRDRRDGVLRFNEIKAGYDRLELFLVATIGPYVSAAFHQLKRYLGSDIAEAYDRYLTRANIADDLSQEKIDRLNRQVVALERNDLGL